MIPSLINNHMPPSEKKIVIIISARQEWRAVRDVLKPPACGRSPYGEWFEVDMHGQLVVFVQGGWGKVNAAASAQYAMDTWQPALLVNLGTCGGLAGKIEKGTIVLAEKTIIYDIYEKMGDAEAAIRIYTSEIDLAWLRGSEPSPVKRGVIVSADRDLDGLELVDLAVKYNALAGDWESGAIAYVARRNGVACLILRGVSDLVGEKGSPAYGNLDLFTKEATLIMQQLLAVLPVWLEAWVKSP